MKGHLSAKVALAGVMSALALGLIDSPKAAIPKLAKIFFMFVSPRRC